MESQVVVARRATSLYVANIVVLLANTLYFLALTNILHSTVDVGIVTALSITILFLVTVCILAQPVTTQSPIPAPLLVLKFMPELLAKGARAGAARVFRISFASTGSLAMIMVGILIAYPNLIPPLIGGQTIFPDFVRLAAVDVLFYSLTQVCFGTLIAVGDLRNAATSIIFWSITRFGLASILLVPYSIYGVLFGWIAGDAATMMVAFRKSTRRLQRGSARRDTLPGNLGRYSFYTLLSALIGFSVTQTDKVFALARQGLPELAIYNVAIVAANITGLAPYALLTVLLPALSALRSTRKTGKMRDMIRNYTRYVSIVVLPIAMGFASVAEVALRMFGLEYVSGLAPTMIVSVVTGLTAIGAVYASALLALGELRWYTTANLLGLGALLAVSAILTSTLGLIGPALGRAALMGVAASVYAFAVHRSGFLELDIRAYLGAAGSSALMGIVVFGALSLIHSFLLQLAFLPLLIILGSTIYLISLRVLHLLTRNDLRFARGIMPARFHHVILRIGRLVVAKSHS